MRTLFSVLARLSKLSKRQNSHELEKTGALVFMSLLFSDDVQEQRVRMTDVSRYMMYSKPAATQLVNRMVEKGYVERVDDPGDRRVVYIQPTPEGKERFTLELEQRMEVMRRAVARMGEEKGRLLAELLTQFLDVMLIETEESQC